MMGLRIDFKAWLEKRVVFVNFVDTEFAHDEYGKWWGMMVQEEGLRLIPVETRSSRGSTTCGILDMETMMIDVVDEGARYDLNSENANGFFLRVEDGCWCMTHGRIDELKKGLRGS